MKCFRKLPPSLYDNNSVGLIVMDSYLSIKGGGGTFKVN